MSQHQLPISAKSFFANEYCINTIHKNVLLLCTTEDQAIESYKQLFFKPSHNFINTQSNFSNTLYFLTIDTIPYNRISPSQTIFSEIAKILSCLVMNNERKLVVTKCDKFT